MHVTDVKLFKLYFVSGTAVYQYSKGRNSVQVGLCFCCTMGAGGFMFLLYNGCRWVYHFVMQWVHVGLCFVVQWVQVGLCFVVQWVQVGL